MPNDGLHHGAEKRRKLRNHTRNTITLLEHALKHAKRALERIRSERNHYDTE